MESHKQQVQRQWQAVCHMTTTALYGQLDAAEDHDDFVMIEAVENELRARELDDSLVSERQAAYSDRNPEMPLPWWSFK